MTNSRHHTHRIGEPVDPAAVAHLQRIQNRALGMGRTIGAVGAALCGLTAVGVLLATFTPTPPPDELAPAAFVHGQEGGA